MTINSLYSPAISHIRPGLKHVFAFLLVVLFPSVTAVSQDIDLRELDKQAQQYFQDKDYNRAVAIWLNILDSQPGDEKIQKKIESVYELKQQKDMEYQKSRLYLKVTRKRFAEDRLKEGISSGEMSINSFITAYRIDPRDEELKAMLDDMKELEKEINSAKDRLRVSEAQRKRYEELMVLAKEEMTRENYDIALKYWEEILSIFPGDVEANEGKRECRLAIDNRLKFEKIRIFMAQGKDLFNKEKYQLAKIEFEQVLKIDERNREAKNYITLINEKIDEVRLYQERMQQAEDFYVSGINNIKKENFDLAQEDLESALALIDNYKDARQRLADIERLRKAYIEREKYRKMETINKEFQDGMLALSDGRFTDAIAAFSKTLYFDPDNKQAQKYLAQAKDAQRQLEEEIVDRNSPYYNVVSALSLSGIELYRKGLYRESMNKWDQILDLFPKNKNANIYRLKCFIEINPGSFKRITETTVADGTALLKKRDFGGALKKFELVKAISANYPNIDRLIAKAKGGVTVGEVKDLTPVETARVDEMYAQALGLYQKGGKKNYERAAELLRYVVDKEPNNTKAIISLNKIEVQLRGGEAGSAVARVELTEEQKLKAKQHYYRGINYYSSNDYRKAIEEWRKVLNIDPDNVKAKNNIRKTLVFLGR